MHLSFLTSHNLLFFRFSKTSKKTTFSVFLSFFLVKSSKSQSLKLNISRMAWPILMILVSFCRILNGLSDEINLFWCSSSPLISIIYYILLLLRTTLNKFCISMQCALLSLASLIQVINFCCQHNNRQNRLKVCLPLLPPISDHVIIQLRGYFSFIFKYSRALSDV